MSAPRVGEGRDHGEGTFAVWRRQCCPEDGAGGVDAERFVPFTRRPVPVLRPTPRRLWELPTAHHCVLLGAAFDARELAGLMRRAGFDVTPALGDYALHSSAVHHAARRGALSELLQKELQKRYAGAVARFRAVTDGASLLDAWRRWSTAGDPIGAYWAAITHPAVDPVIDDLLSQEMHMLSHFAFAERRSAVRRERDLRAQIDTLQNALGRAERRCEAARASAGTLRAELDACRAATRAAEAELTRHRTGSAVAEHLHRIESLETRLAEVARERDALARKIARARAVEATPERIARIDSAPPPAPPPVVKSDVSRLKGASSDDGPIESILCVGGKAGLVARYREVVTAVGSRFLHHDGGLEDHTARLPSMLGAADAVVCLTSEVSHCAYYAVKRYCKRFDKPCVLVANASAGAVAEALRTLQGRG